MSDVRPLTLNYWCAIGEHHGCASWTWDRAAYGRRVPCACVCHHVTHSAEES